MARVDDATQASAPDRDPGSEANAFRDEYIRKRKTSVEDELDYGSPKQARRDSSDRPRPSHHDFDKAPFDAGQERLKSVTQEDKKRGKRLFGGLLSTLSQTGTNNHLKRRQEIETSQREKAQKQRAEDEENRAQKLGTFHSIRMAEQMVFEEKVMRTKHTKRLAVAQFLQTKAEPRVYYLPWKPSSKQEDKIDDQLREAKAGIERELKEFEVRRQRHIDRYGPSRRPNEPPGGILKADTPASSPHPVVQDSEPVKAAKEDHDNDDDVVIGTDEDMVIY